MIALERASFIGPRREGREGRNHEILRWLKLFLQYNAIIPGILELYWTSVCSNVAL